jgi:hypothetical protein
MDVIINYVNSSTNQKLQEYYERLRTVRDVLIKEQQQRSVQTKLELLQICIIMFKNKYNF